MKAIQISHNQELQIIDLEKPQQPQAGEVLLKLVYVGFCGSDINTFMGRNTMALNPVIPGHEVGAVIEAVGANVPDYLKPGMVVTCNPYTNCGKCASCRNGRVNACQHNETLGVQRNGAMREFITLPWEKIIPAGNLDPKNTLEIMSLLEKINQVLTRDELIDIIWGKNHFIDENTIDVYVGYLRSKIDQTVHQEYIKTIRGTGFMMVDGSNS